MAALPARLKWRFMIAVCCAVLVLASTGMPAQPRDPAPSAPQRIVSFVPAATEMLFAMGAGSRLVGVSAYDRFPPEVTKIPSVGGLLDPSVERVLSLRPDLVVIYGSQADLEQQLTRAGLPLYTYVHRDLADVARTMRALGERVGAAAAADREAQRLEAGLDAVRRRVAGLPRPKTLLVLGRQPKTLRQILASGGYGFLHDLLDLAGGADVWSAVKRESVEMSTEMVLSQAPEVIIELHYGREFQPGELEAERRVWDSLGSVPAVRNGRVHLLVGDEFVVPGPRIVAAADRLARTLHPTMAP
jgi:cobalamin transport system substrate-binding protein